MSESAKKSEKIASALYLITSFFDDKEPLKWKIRTLSANLISDDIKDKISLSRELLSLLSLAKTAGLVSETNYNILVPKLFELNQESEKSLDISFLSEPVKIERALPQPQRADYIKDNNTESKLIERPVLKDFGAVSVKKNSRQSIIIAILKRKKEIMIKDVSPLISGCSEKTIQRELSAMVQSRILKKIGEKRWSRYSLA